jgi:soluble lytic murein transglycosylase-like protein
VSDIDNSEEMVMLMGMAEAQGLESILIDNEEVRQKFFVNKKVYKKLPFDLRRLVELISTDGCFLALVHAMIKRESNYNLRATSHAGAVGLMQIMPSTAKFEEKRIKIPINKGKSLYDPKKNVIIGSSIIDRLIVKYDGNIVLAIAAYNCGEGNVSKFLRSINGLKNIKRLRDLDLIELIPIKETRIYVKKVLYYLRMYELIFNENYCYRCN